MAASHTNLEPLLTETEVAKLLNVSVATIRRMRLARQPPEWIKLKASIRYRPEAIRRYIADREQNLSPAKRSEKAVQP